MDKQKPTINLADLPLIDRGNGNEFKSKISSFGKLIGSKGIGVAYNIVEPGQKAFPFHVHHRIHELFVILRGEGTYRFGDEEYPVKTGDVCAAPAGGPDVAHQLINTGSSLLQYLAISTKADTEVVEYPDSGKFAVFSAGELLTREKHFFSFIGRPGSSVDYYDGEQ